ncbi:hypothetical protein VPH35_069600 [Triticum aestivum]
MFSYALRSCRWIICRGYQVVAPMLQEVSNGCFFWDGSPEIPTLKDLNFKLSMACMLQSVGRPTLENQVCSLEWYGSKAIRRGQDLRNNAICQPDCMDTKRQNSGQHTARSARRWRGRSMEGSLSGVR